LRLGELRPVVWAVYLGVSAILRRNRLMLAIRALQKKIT